VSSCPPSDTGGAPVRARVLVADPHVAIRRALAHVIAGEPGIAVVASAGGLRETLEAIRTRRPDVALVDVAVLEGRGVSALRQLLDARPRMAILVMTVVEDPAFHHAAVRHGAAGRVLKDTPAPALARAIHDVAPTGHLRVVPPAG
jgi:DNA-binding NarL/FixJ family response regulator